MDSHARKKISVVCNNTMNLNPGMASEVLAFHAVAARHGYTNVSYNEMFSREEYFSVLQGSQWVEGLDLESIKRLDREFCSGIPIRFERLLGRLDDVASSDAIIYWCGWLHSPVLYRYYKHCLAELGVAPRGEKVTEVLNSHMFLTEQDDKTLRKAASFGQTLIFNSLKHESDPDYGHAYKSFYGRAGAACLRDVLSAKKVSRLRPDFSDITASIDCAMLLRGDDIDRIPRVTTDRDLDFCDQKIAVFFGRSEVGAESAEAIAETLANELRTTAFSLPWGVSYSFPKTKVVTFPSPVGIENQLFLVGDSLSMIRRARIVVSDTYHVCVNAWAMGVPAICVGKNFTTSEFDQNSGYRFSSIDKRYVLYAMIDSLDFYIHTDELADLEFLKAHVRHVAELVNSTASMRDHQSRLRKEADAAEAHLVREIERILQR